jgi:hypothetical protein
MSGMGKDNSTTPSRYDNSGAKMHLQITLRASVQNLQNVLACT